MVVELGDGILGDYGTIDVLKDPEIRRATSLHVFCATDLVGAWGGSRFLAEHEIDIDLFSGPATDNVVGVETLDRALGKPAINAYRHPEKLAALVRDRLVPPKC